IFLVATSQSRTVPSPPPEAMIFPLGLKQTERTFSPSPSSRSLASPVETSQNWIAPSSLPTASVSPSGLKQGEDATPTVEAKAGPTFSVATSQVASLL